MIPLPTHSSSVNGNGSPIGSAFRRLVLAFIGLVSITAASAQGQAPDTILAFTGRVYQDGNGIMDSLINGPTISKASNQQLYVYLIDNQDSIVDKAIVQDNGSFSLTGIAFRSYNVSLSTINQALATKNPTLGLPAVWAAVGEGDTTYMGDGTPDYTISINSGVDKSFYFGIDLRPIGNSYSFNVTVNGRDGFGRVKVPGAAFTGADAEDTPLGTYDQGLMGRSVDLFQASNGTLYYNNIAITFSSASSATRIHNFDTSLVTFDLSDNKPRSFAYSIVDDAGIPELVSNIVSIGTVLPVNLTRFEGRRDNGINILEWTTATERVNGGFDLERSSDGDNFETIGNIPSKALYGNSNSINNYSFRDEKISAEVAVYYYRLRQTDFDGTVTFSKVVKLNAASTGSSPVTGNEAPLSTFPNPSNGLVNLSWNAGADKYTVTVRNTLGAVIMSRELAGTEGVLQAALNLSSLPSGNYLLTTQAGNLKQSAQVTLMTK